MDPIQPVPHVPPSRATARCLCMLLVACLCLSARAALLEDGNGSRQHRDRSATQGAESLNRRLTEGISADADAPLNANADELDYDHESGRLIGKGHVVIVKGETELRADRVQVDTVSGDAIATGNVVLTRGSDVLTSQNLAYNFKTRAVRLDQSHMDVDPFQITSATASRDAAGIFGLTNAVITTCNLEPGHEHYRMVAKSLSIYPDQKVVGRGVKLYVRQVPVFYLPYWYHRPDEAYGFRFVPGFSSRHGAFLLSSYRHPVGKLALEHHLDYRTKRGVAFGEDLIWKLPGAQGDLMLYYADDKEPLAKGEDPEVEQVTNERYRIRLRHRQDTSPRSYLAIQGTYLSDTDLEEDFFPRDYRASAQPDNYITWLHRDDDYTLSLEARGRLNDYYNTLQRIPEARLTLMRRPLFDSNLYYETGMAGSFLQREYAYDQEESYSAARMDWYNRAFYPTKVAGWLNVNPNAGYRLTWYSATAEEQEWIVGVDSNGVDIVETRLVDGPAKLRSLIDLQADLSFKAYKYLDAERQRRHVVEPYATWALVLDPSIDPEELYQFDSIDRLDGSHGIKTGLRNKLQRKWKGEPVTVIDADLFTFLDLDPDPERDMIEEFGWDLRFLPVGFADGGFHLRAYLDGVFDLDDGSISQSSERIQMTAGGRYELELEHRFSRDRNNLLLAEAEMKVNNRWDVGGFIRYEFEDARMEEEGVFFQHHVDCISSRVGFHYWPGYTRSDGSEVEEEYRVMLEIWLRAFPDMRVSADAGY